MKTEFKKLCKGLKSKKMRDQNQTEKNTNQKYLDLHY